MRLFLLGVFLMNHVFASSFSGQEVNQADKLTHWNWVEQFHQAESDSVRLDVLDRQLDELAKDGSPQTKHIYDSMQLYAKSLESDWYRANFYMYLTANYSYIGEYEKGRALTLKAVRIFEQEEDSKKLAKAYYVLGLIHYKLNRFAEALEYLMKSLSIQEELPRSVDLAHCYNAIASVYDLLDRNEKSYEYYHKALAEFEAFRDFRSQGLAYNNLGLLMESMGKNEEALAYMLQARKIFDKEGDLRLLANVTSNVASIYIGLEEYKKAEIEYLRTQELARVRNDQLVMGKLKAGLGRLYAQTQQYDKAKAYLNEALPLLQPVRAMEVYQKLASIDTLLHDYHAFAKHYTSYVALKDSIYNEGKMLKVSELEKKYETRLKDKEIQLLQKENDLQQKQIYLMVVATAGTLLLFLALFFRYRALVQQRKLNEVLLEKHRVEKLRLEESYYAEQKIRELQKVQFKHDIEEKNRELASASLYILNKNQVLQLIKDDLEEVIKQGKAVSTLKTTVRQINSNLTLDEDWEQFRIQFDKVNPDFFSKLRERFDQLTENDIRFLAYMRINLSTKEIAQILNISTKSANMTRYRIRKKVGLNKEDDLMEFVQTI